ncbi:MAG: hypothetical protein QNJ63_01085 [Calothrix sp. MO_192.B10]|nr:hypothetical protein [Calothrix sp. MO_192.B10]
MILSKTNDKYRLIWFQHFHKAGGTSIVKFAQSNSEVLYPCHLNGNPLSPDGRNGKIQLSGCKSLGKSHQLQPSLSLQDSI